MDWKRLYELLERNETYEMVQEFYRAQERQIEQRQKDRDDEILG
jgi:hypothetical protein